MKPLGHEHFGVIDFCSVMLALGCACPEDMTGNSGNNSIPREVENSNQFQKGNCLRLSRALGEEEQRAVGLACGLTGFSILDEGKQSKDHPAFDQGTSSADLRNRVFKRKGHVIGRYLTQYSVPNNARQLPTY